MTTIESILASLPQTPGLGGQPPLDPSISLAALPRCLVASGQFTKDTTTGNYSVTGVGFSPKALLMMSRMNTTTQYTFSLAIATAGLGYTLRQTGGGYITNETKVVALDDNVHLVNATLVSLDTNGFTINYSLAQTSSVTTYLAIG